MSEHKLQVRETTYPRAKIRYYSQEEVVKIIKNYLDPKLQVLKREIDEKQKYIKHLNDKLNDNDLRIRQQE